MIEDLQPAPLVHSSNEDHCRNLQDHYKRGEGDGEKEHWLDGGIYLKPVDDAVMRNSSQYCPQTEVHCKETDRGRISNNRQTSRRKKKKKKRKKEGKRETDGDKRLTNADGTEVNEVCQFLAVGLLVLAVLPLIDPHTEQMGTHVFSPH